MDLVKTLTLNAMDGFEWIKSIGMEYTDVMGQAAGAL